MVSVLREVVQSLIGTCDAKANFIDDTYASIYEPQSYSWDCGPTCCTMVLRFVTAPDQSAMASTFTTPFWTIDLYCFLRERLVRAVMYTTCKGINASHYEEPWYKDHIAADAEHVQEMFQRAAANSWEIILERVSIEALSSMIQDEENVAIILIDNNRLCNPATDVEKVQDSMYAGHYILLVSYDTAADAFLYLDPAGDSSVRRVSSRQLDYARSHAGTDGDLIVCQKH